MRGEPSGGWRGLDTETALASEPEECGIARIRAVDRQAIGRETAQTGPFMLNPLDLPIDDTFEPVDRDRDVQLFGRDITRQAGRFVMRG